MSEPSAGTRIEGVQSPRNPLVRLVFEAARREMGRVPEPVRVTAHHPGLLVGYGMFELAADRVKRVPDRLKVLAVMRTAQLCGCEWCLDFGSAESRAKGVTDDDLKALLDPHGSDRFSEAELLVLDYAEAMTRTPVEVSDELFGRLREHFDEAQLVELTAHIALENYRARFNWAFGIGSEGFSDGAYCAPPALAAAAASSANGEGG